MRYLSVALLTIILTSHAARARDYCEGTTQYDMNMCADLAFEKADKAMNERYAILMKRLDPEDQAKLRQAQRAWDSYRKKLCEFEANGLGSVRPTIFAGCLKSVTDNHINYLDGKLNCQEGELSCKGWASKRD